MLDDRAADRRTARTCSAWPARRPRSPASRRCSSRRAPTCSTCRCSARACSAGTCWRSPSGSGRATSTACATTSTATSRARSTGGRRPARRTLKVRQHSVEGLRRCVVLLDQHVPTGPERRGGVRAGRHRRRQRRPQRRPGRADDPLRDDRRRRPARSRRRRPDAAPAGPHRHQPSARRCRSSATRARGSASSSSIGAGPVGPSSWPMLELGDPALTPIGVFTMDLRHRRPLLAVDARTRGRRSSTAVERARRRHAHRRPARSSATRSRPRRGRRR